MVKLATGVSKGLQEKLKNSISITDEMTSAVKNALAGDDILKGFANNFEIVAYGVFVNEEVVESQTDIAILRPDFFLELNPILLQSDSSRPAEITDEQLEASTYLRLNLQLDGILRPKAKPPARVVVIPDFKPPDPRLFHTCYARYYCLPREVKPLRKQVSEEAMEPFRKIQMINLADLSSN